MKLRWLELTTKYEHWDDRDKEHYSSEYTSEPVLQYFDESSKKWIDVPTFKKKISGNEN